MLGLISHVPLCARLYYNDKLGTYAYTVTRTVRDPSSGYYQMVVDQSSPIYRGFTQGIYRGH